MTLPDLTPTGSPLPDMAPDVGALVSYLEYDPLPAIVLDPQYQILAANRAYQRQFGGEGQAHVGRRCYQVSHHYDVPCDQAGEHCPMKRATESRGADRVLHIHHTPRGPEHVDVELRPIIDTRGEIIAYVERLATVRGASARPSAEGLVGRAPAFNEAISALQRVAPSTLPVLLLGESGTGKELFAHALHEASDRAQRPFVVVDCSGITETLFESELFGFEKGAFTGATSRKPGLVETAQGGTLFLDEIGDVPLSIQVKLLRLIETGTFRRVGGTEIQRADFRLVAATHKPLEQMIPAGQFRADLYFRISAFPIHLPAVRERVEDIALLADSILARIASAGHGSPRKALISPDALALLRAYSWPGNIRELRNVLERASLLADDGVIRPGHLPESLRRETMASPEALPATAFVLPRKVSDAELARAAVESGGKRSELAARLGMSERTLYRRLKALTDAGKV
ncbi:transcriptional regulator with PAS, ATPase and Fis domain [Paraburkholderia silvatlantica]|uniref:Transcriptional regulator with PAS, ATPase and Fis domain n=2 Tax=Paraburkholderia silvatlantica TaxID=321895 RepID=A0ABR6FF54_9BURK|nr:sigma 54-interacting transcriptional regulator [Paraburkholderia silvatlantica]MBB2926060.1 transcriptional regulator with PAS, ATPase and Fis domain [Paraburkholderia silvatlantica]PVY23477.1 Fis family sigma54 specific transcriptional regulator [Paraburkholderia silvatlantica]PXW30516.1 Fis family sigma54 specific transcriptional regulator [Paraburkholderia silvatlantica]